MPYGKFSENGKVAVYKVDADKKRVGKRLGLHPDANAAGKQIAAIMASEKKPKKETTVTLTPGTHIIGTTVTDSEGNTKTSTSTVEVTEDDTENKDYYDDPVEVVLVESSYGPLTFADLLAEEEAREAVYEMQELNYKLQRLITNIMNSDTEDKAGALVALTNEYATLVQKEVDSEDKAASIAKQIVGDNQPKKPEEVIIEPESKSLFIWKEADTYRWLAAYSNNRRDDDNPPEIISSESHKEFDEALEKNEWPMPELWPWHVPFPAGIATFHTYDEITGFPIAGGYFYKGMEWVAEGMIEANWDGTSHGMPSEWIQRDKESPTIIVRHRTKEISPLPNWAAANKLAFFIINKESNMAEEKGLPPHKRDEFVKAFGEERVKQIEETLADKSKSADEAGIEKKEQSQEAPVEDKALTQADLLKALEFVSDGIKASFERLDARLKAIEDSQIEEKDKFDIVEILKAKSIIGKEGAKIDGRSSLAKDAPKEAEAESPTQQAVGMRLSLVDQFIGANEAWYNGGGK